LIASWVILTAAHCYDVIDVAMISLHNLTKAEEASHDVRINSPCMSRHEGVNISRGAYLMH